MTDGTTPPEAAGAGVGDRPRWWHELSFVAGFYLVYSLIRSQADADRAPALANALDIIRVERWMGLYHEETLQDWALRVEPLIIAMNYVYGSLHFVVTPAVLVFLFRRRPGRYRFWRNVLAVTTASALIGYYLWPLMPPRLLPDSYGFVDTLARFPTFWDFESEGVQGAANPYAAMPSLHFAWAAFVGLALWSSLGRRWGLLLGIGYPTLTLATIVLTGNHFFLDAVGGVAVLAVGFAGAHVVEALTGQPLTRWWRSGDASVGESGSRPPTADLGSLRPPRAAPPRRKPVSQDDPADAEGPADPDIQPGTEDPDGGDGGDHPSPLPLLALGALGVVYGDIGTSPLYAMRESFEGAGHELHVDPANVLGILSLIVWSLIIVISIKYLLFVMTADNEGEGGVLVLTSLIPIDRDQPSRRRRTLVLLGLFGTALLYGDGMITPAISVLAAIEGTEVAAPALVQYAVPISIVILVALFAVQSRGTGTVGRAFGPIMIVWFTTLGVLGLLQIVQHPDVLRAVNPVHGARFFADNGMTGFLALGSVFLVVTGGEALYADMGHFGRRAIGVGWFAFVLPGLLLNYFGQGALLIATPEAIDNPFYRLAPSWASIPLMVLATAATVIASQALISGAFSLTMQASQFGYLPRVKVVYTSADERGQIYVPIVNWGLMIACVGLVLGFRTSTALAAAYGVAVTLTMVITTLLYYMVVRHHFSWSWRRSVALCGAFLVVDLAFFGANIPKIPHGGWFPLVVGGIVFALLTTWFTGRHIVRDRTRRGRTPLDEFLDSVWEHPPTRVDGTAVYLYGVSGMAPPPLIYNFRSNHVFHERVLAVNVVTDRVPRVHPLKRMRQTEHPHGVMQVELHYGFMEDPHVADDLALHCDVNNEVATYFLGRETVVVSEREGMAKWREHLFAFLRRNATSAAAYFNLPTESVMEISAQVEL